VSVFSDGQNARPRHPQPEASQGGVREAALGNKDQAFQWLNTAYQERGEGLMGLKTDYSLDGLHSDPATPTCCAGWDCRRGEWQT
jgi:hypothetical protein